MTPARKGDSGIEGAAGGNEVGEGEEEEVVVGIYGAEEGSAAGKGRGRL